MQPIVSRHKEHRGNGLRHPGQISMRGRCDDSHVTAPALVATSCFNDNDLRQYVQVTWSWDSGPLDVSLLLPPAAAPAPVVPPFPVPALPAPASRDNPDNGRNRLPRDEDKPSS